VLERIAKALERIADGSGAFNGVLDGPAAVEGAAAQPAAPDQHPHDFDYGVEVVSDNDSEGKYLCCSHSEYLMEVLVCRYKRICAMVRYQQISSLVLSNWCSDYLQKHEEILMSY